MARNIFSHHYDHCHLNEEEFLRCCLQDDKLCKILVPNVFRIPKPLEEKHRPLLRWKRIRSNLGPGLRQNFGLGKSSCTIFHSEESKFVFSQFTNKPCLVSSWDKNGIWGFAVFAKIKKQRIGIVPKKEEVVHNSFHKFSSKKGKRTFGQFDTVAEEDKGEVYLPCLSWFDLGPLHVKVNKTLYMKRPLILTF